MAVAINPQLEIRVVYNDKLAKAEMKKLIKKIESQAKIHEQNLIRIAGQGEVQRKTSKKTHNKVSEVMEKTHTTKIKSIRSQANAKVLAQQKTHQNKSVSSQKNYNAKMKGGTDAMVGNLKTLALAYIAMKGFQLLGSSVEDHILQQRAILQVAQAVKRTGENAGFTARQLLKMAAAMQMITGVGDEQILLKVTNQLLTFGNITGEVFERAQAAILDLNAVISGGEESSLISQSIQLGKALNDPVLGITALTRVGISFTEEQKELIKSLVDENKLFEAQSIILTEIEKQYGGQAAVLNEATGGTKGLSASLGDLSEKMGGLVLKLGGPLIKLLSGVVTVMNQIAGQSTTAADKYQDQVDKVQDLTDNLEPLIEKYDKLNGIAERTSEEQETLNETIDAIIKIMPEAALRFDRYGKAIGISRTKLQDLVKLEKERLAILKQEDIDDAVDNLQDLARAREELQNILNQSFDSPGVQSLTDLWFSDDTNEKMVLVRDDLIAINKKMDEQRKVIADLRAGTVDLGEKTKKTGEVTLSAYEKMMIAIRNTNSDRVKAIEFEEDMIKGIIEERNKVNTNTKAWVEYNKQLKISQGILETLTAIDVIKEPPVKLNVPGSGVKTFQALIMEKFDLQKETRLKEEKLEEFDAFNKIKLAEWTLQQEINFMSDGTTAKKMAIRDELKAEENAFKIRQTIWLSETILWNSLSAKRQLVITAMLRKITKEAEKFQEALRIVEDIEETDGSFDEKEKGKIILIIESVLKQKAAMEKLNAEIVFYRDVIIPMHKDDEEGLKIVNEQMEKLLKARRKLANIPVAKAAQSRTSTNGLGEFFDKNQEAMQQITDWANETMGIISGFQDNAIAGYERELEMLQLLTEAENERWAKQTESMEKAGFANTAFALKEKKKHEKILAESLKAEKAKEAEILEAKSAGWVMDQIGKGTQVIMSTAQAIMAAFSVGPIIGAIMSPIIGALGIAQGVLIASQTNPYKQKKAMGGFIPGSGFGDSVGTMLTPGEFVVNRVSARENAQALEDLNSGAALEGGKSTNVFITVEGNIISEDTWVEDNLIPKIQVALDNGHELN